MVGLSTIDLSPIHAFCPQFMLLPSGESKQHSVTDPLAAALHLPTNVARTRLRGPYRNQ